MNALNESFWSLNKLKIYTSLNQVFLENLKKPQYLQSQNFNHINRSLKRLQSFSQGLKASRHKTKTNKLSVMFVFPKHISYTDNLTFQMFKLW